jgi:hypothetical protein
MNNIENKVYSHQHQHQTVKVLYVPMAKPALNKA